jgi:hypothetical protein
MRISKQTYECIEQIVAVKGYNLKENFLSPSNCSVFTLHFSAFLLAEDVKNKEWVHKECS